MNMVFLLAVGAIICTVGALYNIMRDEGLER